MSVTFTQVAPNSVGNRIVATALTENAVTVQRQWVELAGSVSIVRASIASAVPVVVIAAPGAGLHIIMLGISSHFMPPGTTLLEITEPAGMILCKEFAATDECFNYDFVYPRPLASNVALSANTDAVTDTVELTIAYRVEID